MTDPKQMNLYAVLEVEPGATDDEIRRAHKRLIQLFDPAGMVVYGLYRESDAKRLLERLKEAYETLMDPEKRRLYDLNLFPKGHPSLRRADERVAMTPPRRMEIVGDPFKALNLGAEDLLSGDALRQLRELCGISLQEIADRTKISLFALRSIENEQFSDLPAPVYLTGFLKQIAQFLHIDPARLVHDYMARLSAWRASALPEDEQTKA